MSRYPRPTQTTVLSTYSLSEALDTLLGLDQDLGIIPPAHHEATLSSLHNLVEQAGDLELHSLDQVLARASDILAVASGVSRVRQQQYLKTSEADPLHQARNLLMAITLAALVDHHGDPSEVLAQFPKLSRARTPMRHRPYTDDEILLLRIWALHLSHGDKNHRRSAAVYAQVDSGLIAGETTSIRPSNLTLDPGCGTIQAPGHGAGVAARTIFLDRFAVHLLRTYLDNTPVPDNERLTYRPRKAYTYDSAAASAIGVIDRVRKPLGLQHCDTTNASVWMWRAASTQLTHGLKAATALSGRTKDENLLGLLWSGNTTATSEPKKAKKSFGLSPATPQAA